MPRSSPRWRRASARSTSTSPGCARTGAPARPSTASAAASSRGCSGAFATTSRLDQLLQIARRLLGPEGLTEKQTAFAEPEVVMAWAQAHTQGAEAERVRRLASRLTATDGVE